MVNGWIFGMYIRTMHCFSPVEIDKVMLGYKYTHYLQKYLLCLQTQFYLMAY